MANSVKFEHGGKDYIVRRPTVAQVMNSEIVGASAFRAYVESGVFLKAEIERMLEERGIVTPDDVSLKNNYPIIISDLDSKFDAAQTDEEKEQIRKERESVIEKRNALFMKEWPYLSKTADSLAEQVARSYLVSACTIFAETGELVWNSMGMPDYVALQEDDDQELVNKAFVQYGVLTSDLMVAENVEVNQLESQQGVLTIASVEDVIEPIILDKSFDSGKES